MLWLVRHGESVANAGGVVHTDFASIPLTARGRLQADAVAAACGQPPVWVGLSPYLRARQTAGPLLARYPAITPIELPVQEFTYLAAGQGLGMDAVARQLLVDAYWSRLDPSYCDGEGAESFAELCERAESFLRTVTDLPSFGVVFTHEQFIRAVLVAATYPGEGPSIGLMRRFFGLRTGLPIPNAAVVRLRREGERWWVGGIDTSHSADRPAE